MNRLTDKEIEAMLQGSGTKTLSEELGHRGAGRLVVKKHGENSLEFRFKYYRDRKTPVEISIGRYQPKRSKTKVGLTTAEARKRAIYYSHQLQAGIDPRKHLEDEKFRQEEERRHKEAEANRGTLLQLLNVYIEDMKKNDKRTWDQVEKDIDRYVIKPFPQLMQINARDIEPEHITEILARMYKNGLKATINRVRSYSKSAVRPI